MLRRCRLTTAMSYKLPILKSKPLSVSVTSTFINLAGLPPLDQVIRIR